MVVTSIFVDAGQLVTKTGGSRRDVLGRVSVSLQNRGALLRPGQGSPPWLVGFDLGLHTITKAVLFVNSIQAFLAVQWLYYAKNNSFGDGSHRRNRPINSDLYGVSAD